MKKDQCLLASGNFWSPWPHFREFPRCTSWGLFQETPPYTRALCSLQPPPCPSNYCKQVETLRRAQPRIV